MSIEFVGFENLPNAYIKEIGLFQYSETETEVRVIVRVHDLQDGSIWSDTSEFLAQFIKISVLFSEDRDQSNQISAGTVDITTLKNIQSRSIKNPMKTEDNLVYEYSFSHIIKNNPSHLSVYAFCYIDKKQILENLGIVLNKSYLGPIKAERVFDGSTLFENTYVFMRDNGEYWTGPIHQAEDGRYMIGSYHTTAAHEFLRRMVLKNTKIKDMRATKQSQEKKSIETTNYISDLQVSYNSDTDINAMFMLNIKSLLKQQTKYGSFLERASDNIVAQIINDFSIKLMTIERMRIKTFNQPTALRSSKPKAQKVYSKKMIIKTYDQDKVIRNITRLERQGVYDVVENELRSASSENIRKKGEIFKEQLGDYKKVSKISEMFFDYGEEIRTFQFNDYELTEDTPGDYQYNVNINFIDPVAKFLKQATTQMKQDLSDIKRYVGYSSRSRDLTQANVDYQRLVESYVNNYSYVYQMSQREKSTMISKKLNLLSPSAATLQSVKNFEKQYRDLYSEFISFLDYDPEIPLRRNIAVSIKSKDSTTARILVSKTFDKIITPSMNKYGFDYMNGGKKDAMQMFSKRQYEERTVQETETNFIEDPNAASPDLSSEVNSGLRDITSFSPTFFAPLFGKLGSDMFKMGIDKTVPFSKVNQLVNKAQSKFSPIGIRRKTNLLNSGITTKKPSIMTETKQETPEGEGAFIDASSIIGSGHEFVTYEEVKDSYNIIDKETTAATKINNTTSGFINNRTFDITLNNTKLLTGGEAAALPNQLKAVIGGTTSATRNNYISSESDLLANPNTKNYYEVNNFSVKKVAYIDGFVRDINGNLLLNQPVYKMMSLDNFSTLDKPVLCFLQSYTNNKFNITDENSTSVLDSVFVLTDKDVTTPPNRETIQTQSNYNIQNLSYLTMRSEVVVQTNQPVTVGINQTADNVSQTSTVPVVNRNTNLFGSY